MPKKLMSVRALFTTIVLAIVFCGAGTGWLSFEFDRSDAPFTPSGAMLYMLAHLFIYVASPLSAIAFVELASRLVNRKKA